LVDVVSDMTFDKQAAVASGAKDISMYLSSRYLNPAINGPRFDLRKIRNF
jgi:hypothetical protein